MAAAPEDEAGDWACLTAAELDADLLECEAADDSSGQGGLLGESSLQEALRRGLGSKIGAALESEAFFAAPKALQCVAAELQELLVDVDTLRFEAASLAASIAHGPLRPPAPAARGGSGTGRDAGSPAGPPAAVGEAIAGEAPVAEAFGLAAAPTAPPALELSPPSGAVGGPPDYKRRLEALPRALYIERKVRLCMGEVDKYQDGKDIGRDELIVNGAHLSGAKGGYAAAVEAIAAGLRAGDRSEAWPPEPAERAAQLLLSVLNRTSSGFAAFEEVLRLYDCHDAVIVSPDSAAARPLEASVVSGCALGRAHTRYAVRGLSGDGAPLAVIDTEFCFRIPTALLRQLVEPGSGDGSWGDGWEVEGWASEEIPAAILLRWSPPAAAPSAPP